MTDTASCATGNRLGQFVDESLRAAAMLALLFLVLEALVPGMSLASAPRLLAIAAGLGIAKTAVIWALKARLRTRWPAVDSLT